MSTVVTKGSTIEQNNIDSQIIQLYYFVYSSSRTSYPYCYSKLIFIFTEDMLELLMANKEWLEARPKADLSRRPEHTKTDELDMNGTFKKLQID